MISTRFEPQMDVSKCSPACQAYYVIIFMGAGAKSMRRHNQASKRLKRYRQAPVAHPRHHAPVYGEPSVDQLDIAPTLLHYATSKAIRLEAQRSYVVGDDVMGVH